MKNKIVTLWYQATLHPVLLPLVPLSWLFAAIAALRRISYRSRCLPAYRAPVPIIVVGNITVGGTGKTPFVIWLVQWLKDQGWQPGIVSRGVGGEQQQESHWVNLTDPVARIGDEAYLLKHATRVPFVIAKNRTLAVKKLLANSHCNIVISDDGLQHYRLQRDLEIVLVDNERLFGNGRLLPAGPLREPVTRLKQADLVIYNGNAPKKPKKQRYQMHLQPGPVQLLCDPTCQHELHNFPHRTVHAVAGIGNPERFFASLRAAGLTVIPHPFPDHHRYQRHDFNFSDQLPIMMTEKDAVKCREFADERFWCHHISVVVSEDIEQYLHTNIPALEATPVC